MAFSPTPKNPGDLIRAQDWNEALDEVVRLESAKLDIAGGAISGSLSVARLGIGQGANPIVRLSVRDEGDLNIALSANAGSASASIFLNALSFQLQAGSNQPLILRTGSRDRLRINADGKVGIGVDPAFTLDVGNRMRIRQQGAETAGTWLFQTTPNADRAFIGMADDNNVGFWGNAGIGWGLQMDVSNGNIRLEGDLSIRKTGDGYARFTNDTYTNENTFQANNLKLSMASTGGFIIIGQPPTTYEFAIGHTFTSPLIGGGTSFVKNFSVNHAGNVTIAGSISAGGGKGGYVIDNFINAVGEPLEQGDVVVVGSTEMMQYYGQNNSIPIPEVDLTDRAYDTRVCGIVESVVRADSLPPFEMQYPTEAEVKAAQEEKNARRRKAAEEALAARMVNPLEKLAAPVTAELDTAQVGAGQLGKMVTLGAYAFCKVDADIAAIEAGDLLTTSPTRGHAQKVTEPEKAVGAIIGKALGSLKKGKGKIPVMVLMQ